MVVTAVSPAGYSAIVQLSLVSPAFGRARDVPVSAFRPKRRLWVSSTLRSVWATQQHTGTKCSVFFSYVNQSSVRGDGTRGVYDPVSEEGAELGLGLTDFFVHSKDLIKPDDGGPPRWFSPLDCGGSRFRIKNAPLLLYLPGIDGLGLGLMLHHHRLGEMFDTWCLHIPATDRSPFAELVKLVEGTVRQENNRSPTRPIYLVGESFGACLALAVAAHNPDVDLILVLANPATCFGKSQMLPLIPLLEIMPRQLRVDLHMLTLMTGTALKMATGTLGNGFSLQPIISEMPRGLGALLFFLLVLVGVFKVETLLWKLKMVETASMYANSRLHAVKSQALLLASGKDELLPSLEETERLRHMLPNCAIRTFHDSSHFLFLEHSFDLVMIVKATSFYRRARYFDYVLDYLPPSPAEFRKVAESHRWVEAVFSPVMLSTLDSGKIVRGLTGIPSEGPVLFVGYHMMLGLELAPIVSNILSERNVLVRGVAHPMMFTKLREGKLPDVSTFDGYRIMGAVPVSAANLYKLFSSKAHILLYPGGMREALHRKGEEYQLFWPEQSEFVRMAARFGATIVPFGAVGEDDIGQLILDYEDQIKIPFLKAFIEELTEEAVRLRIDAAGEVGNQDVHLPILLPKIPGRFYYLFGTPIKTEGRKEELRDRDKAHELYLEVKSEVQICLAYLKEKRESDPFRNILARSVYQVTHGFESEVPTFEI